MTPPTKSRFEMILGVKEHEMRHRGQLMVMERMVGVVPHLTREFQARMATWPPQRSNRETVSQRVTAAIARGSARL
jgi:uncharacterized damage-inducible protein DinB